MLKKYKIIIILFTALITLSVGSFVFAQDNLGLNAASNIGLGTPAESDLRVVLVNIVRYFLGFLGIIAVAVVLYAGFLWMTSAGRPDQLIKAKRTLINGIVGLVIVLSAFAIVTFIVNLFEGGGGAGRDPRPGGPLGGLGALGACAVESVYPAPGQRDVPRNTSIIVTFKADVDAGTVIAAGLIIPENIHIYLSAQGDSCQWDGSAYVNCDSTNLTDVTAVQSGRTFVFTPNSLMGNANGSTDYSVRLDQNILDQNGRSIFADCRTDSLIWNFEVSNRLDLTPPQVRNNGVIPAPDNDQDTVVPTAAVVAEGAIRVLSRPQAGQAAAAGLTADSPNGGTVVVDPANIENGIVWAAVLSDGITAQLSRSGGAPLLGSAVFSGQTVNFSGYFSLTAADSVAAGQIWYVELAGRQNADTLTIGPLTYNFVLSGAGAGEINLGGDSNGTAANIAAAINAGHPSVSAVNPPDTPDINLSARVSGAAGNNINLRTNNPARFSFTPMSGGADAYTSLQTAGQPDPSRNIIVQISFNEAINPVAVSGHSEQVATAIQVRCLSGDCANGTFACGAHTCVSGRFEVSNQYRTVEFIPEVECGVNSCGETVYCLPSNSNIRVWLRAATLAPCSSDNDCLSRQNFNTCSNLGGGNHCNNGSFYYPLSDLSALDGIMDAASNSLDGNRNNNADGPVSDYNENNPSSGGGDNYAWSFFVSDDINTTPPAISSVSPGISGTNVDLTAPLSLVFDKPMQSSSLRTGQTRTVINNKTITHRHINLWNYANRATGYWITSENGFDGDGFPVSTAVSINHSVFGPLLTYRAQVGSGVRDIYQNCFRPAAGPGCTGPFNSCCNGVEVVEETCP